jgi:hypothetical protein
MAKKNIVIAPCGNKSFLFREAWLKQADQREFDICLLFYHETINKPELYNGVDFFFHLKGFKYKMLYDLLTDVKPEWLEEYDYFYFLDDDIEIDTISINQLFLLSRAMGSWISQAALSRDSFCSWPMFKQADNSWCRYVGQIEVMSPLFGKAALRQCLSSFIGNKSSWGMDSVWPKILGYPKDKLLVFDTVIMRHTLPVGGGELYQKIGVDPHDEWNAITRQYGARKHNYQEYGRLQLVSEKRNKTKFFYYKSIEFVNYRLQDIRDYGFGARVRSRLRKLLKKNVKNN